MAILDEELPFLGPEFDAESWEYLQTTYPSLAEKLEKEIGDGRKPEQIYNSCVRRLPPHRHNTLCRRLLMAGRHLYGELKQS